MCAYFLVFQPKLQFLLLPCILNIPLISAVLI